jgi:hypothetical protein
MFGQIYAKRDARPIMAESHHHILPSQASRYLAIKDELETYLKEIYSGKVDDTYDFSVKVSLHTLAPQIW